MNVLLFIPGHIIFLPGQMQTQRGCDRLDHRGRDLFLPGQIGPAGHGVGHPFDDGSGAADAELIRYGQQILTLEEIAFPLTLI